MLVRETRFIFYLYQRAYLDGTKKIKSNKISFLEISKRELMARKAAKIGKFQIIDFLNLKNLKLHTYPHNYLTNILVKYF